MIFQQKEKSCSIFNSFFIGSLKTLWAQLGAPLLIKRLSNDTQEHGKRHHVLGDLNMTKTNKNKQPSFIDG